MPPKTADRIEVVDALRGIALFAIVIVHCLEHYNLYYIPDDYPQWLTSLDIQAAKRFVRLSQNDLCDFHVY